MEAGMEACEVCGYEWDAVRPDEVPTRLRAAAAGWAEVLGGSGTAGTRPDATTWSTIEYGAHARDVMFNLRDRIILGLALDNPVPHTMYGTLRVESGLYAADDAARLSTEIDVASDLLARTIEALSVEQLSRPIFYGWPRDATRTLLWVAAQALHESEHHLDDARDNARRLAT